MQIGHDDRRVPALCRRRARGGSSVEYMLVLALVVIPIALLSPMWMRMVTTYAERIALVIRTPFG